MNRRDFIATHESTWARAEAILDALDAKATPGGQHTPDAAALPELYRRCCHHLALVRQRHYGGELEDRLNRIAVDGYHQLYQRSSRLGARWVRFLLAEFPQLVRRRARLFWLATALFYGPGLAMGLLVLDDPAAVETLLDAESLRSLEAMYAEAPGDDRAASSRFEMFGFYVYNNVGIALRTFAGGILLGLGSLFFLIYNGLYLGAVFAHLTHLERSGNLLEFVITHGAFELTAIVLAGVGGLCLGQALVAPGRRTRREALRAAAPEALQIAVGAGAMLLLAAFIEAFWSSSTLATGGGKLLVGGLAWLVVTLHLALGGSRGS